jgi:valyl-tRNA synthetase
MLKASGHLVPWTDKDGAEHDAEPRTIATPFGDRGGVVIEPWLTDQWYVDAEKLAQAPMQAVRDGAIEIVPKSWEKTFFNWMENIQPWCVSRQLWWGHRIPAWYGPTREGDRLFVSLTGKHHVLVADDEHELMAQARTYYGNNEVVLGQSEADALDELLEAAAERRPARAVIWRDPDVLDTWFSSALWPFATLGWPDGDAQLLQKHYPNSLLISGFDILFFWDARMMMMGMHFLPEVPWKRLYLHGLVRAPDGQKMSKSKGNVVDPLGLIDRFGADALRFFMAAMESQGRDIKMDEARVEGYRNFATKLWNAARFCQANGIGASTTLAAPPATSAVNRWIIGEIVETQAMLDEAMAELRFDAAAGAIYHFTWDRFCDWYLELIKPTFGEDYDEYPALQKETRIVAGWVLDQILVMLHPFMPFVTEELWHAQGERPYELILAKWPRPDTTVDADAKHEIEWLIRLVSSIRAVRNELNVPVASRLTVSISGADDQTLARLGRNLPPARRLCRVAEFRRLAPEFGVAVSPEGVDRGTIPAAEAVQGGAAQIVLDEATIIVHLEGVIDIEAEKARLAKARAASEKERDVLVKRLQNPAFIERAKPEAVEKARADHAHHQAEVERLEAALARLG